MDSDDERDVQPERKRQRTSSRERREVDLLSEEMRDDLRLRRAPQHPEHQALADRMQAMRLSDPTPPPSSMVSSPRRRRSTQSMDTRPPSPSLPEDIPMMDAPPIPESMEILTQQDPTSGQSSLPTASQMEDVLTQVSTEGLPPEQVEESADMDEEFETPSQSQGPSVVMSLSGGKWNVSSVGWSRDREEQSQGDTSSSTTPQMTPQTTPQATAKTTPKTPQRQWLIPKPLPPFKLIPPRTTYRSSIQSPSRTPHGSPPLTGTQTLAGAKTRTPPRSSRSSSPSPSPSPSRPQSSPTRRSASGEAKDPNVMGLQLMERLNRLQQQEGAETEADVTLQGIGQQMSAQLSETQSEVQSPAYSPHPSRRSSPGTTPPGSPSKGTRRSRGDIPRRSRGDIPRRSQRGAEAPSREASAETRSKRQTQTKRGRTGEATEEQNVSPDRRRRRTGSQTRSESSEDSTPGTPGSQSRKRGREYDSDKEEEEGDGGAKR